MAAAAKHALESVRSIGYNPFLATQGNTSLRRIVFVHDPYDARQPFQLNDISEFPVCGLDNRINRHSSPHFLVQVYFLASLRPMNGSRRCDPSCSAAR
jgi:hypothetical protein